MKEFINYDKSIKSIMIRAEKGDFFAAYQLHKYFKHGKYIAKDLKLEKEYFNLAYSLFSHQKISLKNISIENFKVFNEVRLIGFDNNLNIFVGINGAGKTTVLDAIAMSLSWLVNTITKNGGVGYLIDDDDINVYSELPFANITSLVSFNENINASLELSQSKSGIHKKKNHLLDFRKIGAFYKEVNEIDSSFNMPLFAYYNVFRSQNVSQKDISLSVTSVVTDNFDKFKGYNNSLSGKADFSSFIEWFKALDDIDTRRRLGNFEQGASKVYSDDFLSSISEIVKKNKNLSEELRSVMNSILVDNIASSDNHPLMNAVDGISKVKAALNNVIETFMEGYGSLELVLEPKLDLTIVKNDKKISVLKLSQGEKTLLSLVIDIAMRLFLLNPSLENPLEGEGIVLIDEFDLHLHPKWQREVVSNLPLAFPNCQFFLTTHSSLALGEVKPNQIYILNKENDEIIISQPEQSYGLSSNEILNELMNSDGEVEQLGRNIEVENALNDIFCLIEIETCESLQEAREKIIRLETELNGDIPELVQAKVKLDLISWGDNESD